MKTKFAVRNLHILFIFLFLHSCSQQKNTNTTLGKAGFKTFRTVDKSRTYKPGTDTSNILHYRPVDLDVWYPAQVSTTDTTLFFKNLFGLLLTRSDFYTGTPAPKGVLNQIAQSFSTGFHCSDTTQLLNYKTSSYPNAKTANGKFPLIVYLSSFNSMCYENFPLFEELASNGYVVASINSIGRYPGDMTMKNDDLLQQVFDAVASVNYLENNHNIDFSKIGIIGYSWGGLAGAILQNKLSNVKCLISFDGSEFHHYGEAKDENTDFEEIKSSDNFKSMNINIPYLRLESSPIANSFKKDSVYNFSEKLIGKNLILKIDSAEHQDFSCLPFITRTSGNCQNNSFYTTSIKLTIAYLNDHLKNTNSFSETLNEVGKKVVKK
ncbi:MAG: dienelactone hydrolase family protein [Ferruginibacter sp.]